MEFLSSLVVTEHYFALTHVASTASHSVAYMYHVNHVTCKPPVMNVCLKSDSDLDIAKS